MRHHRSLVQIDTSSPPGNETKVVDYLKKIFEAEGIPVKTFALQPSRANLVARLKGNGKKRPILLMAHTDVVGVQREKWPVDPFGAVLKDGYIWGRGSRDDKDKLAANLMVMLLAKRMGVALDRDLIFLAESGEEADPAGVGISYMVNQHFDEIDAEFALTEGGGATLENGRVTVVNIQTTEKVPRRFRLIASGTSGHGSVPRLDNPLIHLSAAVAKIGSLTMPMRLNETTRTYFERLAAISPPEKAARYRALLAPQPSAAIQNYLAENEPERSSMIRTSVVPTILKAGVGPNVIPSEAEATFDVRALPDEDIPKLFEELKRVINDPAVKVEPITVNLRPCRAVLAARFRHVSRLGKSQRRDVSRLDGFADHVDRRDRHGAVARQRDSILRNRAGQHRERYDQLWRPQRCGAAGGILALPLRGIHLARGAGSGRQQIDPPAA